MNQVGTSDTPRSPRALDLLPGVDAEIIRFLSSLSADDWAHPSLCAHWTVRQVAAHLVSGLCTSIRTFSWEMARHRGRFHRASESIVDRISVVTGPTDLQGQLEAGFARPTGLGRLLPAPMLLGDHLVHLLDMATPLERHVDIDRAAYTAVLRTELTVPNPFTPGARVGRGLSFRALDTQWQRSTSGPVVTGNARDIVLALAGRTEALARLSGSGVERIARRLGAQLVPGRTDWPGCACYRP